MAPLRVAVVGCGWVAGSQMERGWSQLPDLFEVRVACDVDGDKARAYAAKHAVPEAVDDFAALVCRDDIDVVTICTPPSLHYEMVVAALKAGKHTVCEKPFTSSLKLIDEVIALQADTAARVMPIFQYRFGAGVDRIRHLLRSGLQGRAFTASVETAWRRTADYYAVPWRGKFATELGGVLLTQAIHIHDLVLDLVGPVTAVKAFKSTRVNPIEVEDCAVASLELESGGLVSLTATLGSMRPVTRIRLCYETMTVERQGFDAAAIRPGDEPWEVIPATPEIGAEADAVMVGHTPRRADFAGQFGDFHEALATGRPFAVTLADARRALELITALYHAAETGETVRLPIGPNHPRYDGWVPR